MIYFPSNALDKIEEANLVDFLAMKHRENRFLDYKLKYDLTKRDSKKELLKDVTALANSQGGNLLIGISEVDEDGATVPDKLKGIEDGPDFVSKARDICNDSIDPRVNGLIMKDIKLANENWAVIVYVPPSLSKPHMAGLQKGFYIRREDRSLPMTTDEVKNTVLEVVNLEKNISEYKNMIERNLMNIYLGGHFGFVMHAIPLVLEENQINTDDEEIRNLLQDRALDNEILSIISNAMPTPTLYGVMGECGRNEHYFQTYINRNGYIGLVFDYKEILLDSDERENKIINNYVIQFFRSFMQLCTIVTETAMLSMPYQIFCEFKNAEESRFPAREYGEIRARPQKIWRLTEIKLPPVRIHSFKKSEDISNLFYKRLRNAFGLE